MHLHAMLRFWTSVSSATRAMDRKRKRSKVLTLEGSSSIQQRNYSASYIHLTPQETKHEVLAFTKCTIKLKTHKQYLHGVQRDVLHEEFQTVQIIQSIFWRYYQSGEDRLNINVSNPEGREAFIQNHHLVSANGLRPSRPIQCRCRIE